MKRGGEVQSDIYRGKQGKSDEDRWFDKQTRRDSHILQIYTYIHVLKHPRTDAKTERGKSTEKEGGRRKEEQWRQ